MLSAGLAPWIPDDPNILNRLLRNRNEKHMNEPVDPTATRAGADRFEQGYRDERTAHGLPVATPWDIGGAQPVVQQLVALGAVTGEVLDPGTGPGHHAIFYASKGLSVTGIDASRAAIERAEQNARRAGVSVNFQVADATKLEGLEDRFSTVVDCAFYHTFSLLSTDHKHQKSYMQALHRATKPHARLFMFEFGAHDVNGFGIPHPLSLSENDFTDVLPAAGWDITYLGPTTYQGNLSIESIEVLSAVSAQNPQLATQTTPWLQRLRIIEPWLTNGRAHAPFWEVHATRRG